MAERNHIHAAYELALRIRGFDTKAMAEEIDARAQRLRDLGWPTDSSTFQIDRDLLNVLGTAKHHMWLISQGKPVPQLSDSGAKE